MSKEYEDDIDIDSIVIEDIDVRDIEDRKLSFGKEEDVFGEGFGKEAEETGGQPEEDREQAEKVDKQLEEVNSRLETEEEEEQDEEQELDQQLEEINEQLETEEEEEPGDELGQQLKELSRQLEKSEKDSRQEKAPVSDLEDIKFPDSDPELGVLSYDQEDYEEYADNEVYEGKTRRKRSKGDVVRYCVMFVALCVLVYSVFSLVTIFMEYKAGEKEYEDLEKYAQGTAAPDTQQAPGYIDENDPLNPNFQIANVDWAGLKEENSDICAWIQFETLGQINYPVVQGTDDDYYLKHTINHTENSAGSIFVEAQNNNAFTDMNTIIYGHNMKNGSMFGLLRYYKEASYYAGNEYFWIYTPQGNYRYKIFSCYEPMAVSETYSWWDGPCDEYTAYLSKIQSYSKYSTGVSVGPSDKIVTLSTCTSRGSDYRFVVHGKLVYSSAGQ